MPKKIVYRIGDIVRINNPDIVKKVGYTFDKTFVKENAITPEQKEELRSFLATTFGISDCRLFQKNHMYGKTYDAILDEIAYFLLHRHNFRGEHRYIISDTISEYKGCLAEVQSKRIVKTGEYSAGGWYDSMDDGDYEPPYLKDEKTHVILSLRIFPDEDLLWSLNIDTIEIDECNVSPHILQTWWKGKLSDSNGKFETYTIPAKTREEAVDIFKRHWCFRDTSKLKVKKL